MEDQVPATNPPQPTPNPADPPPAPPPQTSGDAPPQRVFRTYASDMAALGQKPAMPTPKTPVPAPAPVSGPAYNPSEAPRIVLPPKPAPSSGFLSGVFGRKDADLKVTVLPSSAPSAWASAPAYAPPSPKPEAEDRDSILARLKARAPEPLPPLPPVFPAPKVEAAPPPPPAAAPQADERLRTYSGDFSTRVDTQQASAFSVLAAQSDAQPTPAATLPPKKTDHTLIFIIAGTVLIAGGSLALYYAYSFLKSEAPVEIFTTEPPSLLSGEETFALSGSGPALIDALAAEVSEPLTIGNVRVAFLEVSSTTPTGVVTEKQPGGALIRAMELHAPDILLRNITDNSTVGIIRAGEDTRVFFVLGTNSYERTFAGMLSWEATIEEDLAAFYPAHPEPLPVIVATTTASSTASATTTPPAPAFVPGFVDAVVGSHDVRLLQDAHGRTVLIYGYRDQRTLIIARDETAFSVLLARVGAQ